MKGNPSIEEELGPEHPALFPKPKPKKPTSEQVAEVTDPTLSMDSFQVGSYDVPIRILPYSSEKKMALVLDPMIQRVIELMGGGTPKEGEVKKPSSLYDIFKEHGMSLVVSFADDLFKVIHVICQKYHAAITLEYIMDNLNLYQAWDILVKQLEKNQIGDIVTNFFYKVATLLPKISTKPESQQS